MTTPSPVSDPISNLAKAMVVNSDTPLIMLDENLLIIAASISFCRAFGLDCAVLPGTPILKMGHGEWDVQRLKSLLYATGRGGAKIEKYELTLPDPRGHDRHLQLSAHRLDYPGSSSIFLLLTVVDATEAFAFRKE